MRRVRTLAALAALASGCSYGHYENANLSGQGTDQELKSIEREQKQARKAQHRADKAEAQVQRDQAQLAQSEAKAAQARERAAREQQEALLATPQYPGEPPPSQLPDLPPEPRDTATTVSGELKEAGGGQILVLPEDKHALRLQVYSGAAITLDGKAVTEKELPLGSEVRVTYYTGSQYPRVRSIEAVSPKASGAGR